MKISIIILAIALVVLSAFFVIRENANQQQAETLKLTEQQLDGTSNRVVAVEATMAALQQQTTKQIAELQQSVTTVNSEKTQSEGRAKELQTRLATVEADLADEKAKLTNVDDERVKVVSRLTNVTGELAKLNDQYATLQKSNSATEAELTAVRNKMATLRNNMEELEQEHASLERRFNDLDELRAQISIVKERLWEEHVADWKKRDLEAGRAGNGGVLLKNGQWFQ